jgi:hypothetical protein
MRILSVIDCLMRTKAVYQKFETELAKALSNIVIKQDALNYSQAGSVIKPYTFTPKFNQEYFANAKQWGVYLFCKSFLYIST